MYTCFKCRRKMTLDDVLEGTCGNTGSVFCKECTKECKEIEKELLEAHPLADCIMSRYISMVSWGIDPAGAMYPVYIDNNLTLRRRETQS